MPIKLDPSDAKQALSSIQRYFEEEHEQDLCDLKAGLLLDFFLKEIGPLAYNKGVGDAEAYFRDKLEDLTGSCYEHGLTYWNQKRS